jgi:hypothetical protein
VTFDAAVAVANLTADNSSIVTLNNTGTVTAALTTANGGNAVFNGAATVGTTTVNSGSVRFNTTLTTSSPVVVNGGGNATFGQALAATNTVNVNAGSASFIGGLTAGSTVNVTGTGESGGYRGHLPAGVNLNVPAQNTINYNPAGTITSVIPNFTGSTLQVSSGVVNFGTANLSPGASTTVTNAAKLEGRRYDNQVNPPGGFGTEAGLAFTLRLAPTRTAELSATSAGTTSLNFGGQGAADGAFNTFYGANGADVFTSIFRGRFTAPTSGAFTFGQSLQDDNSVVWVDLNQNGIFEQNGTAGNEKLFQNDCCGNGDANNTTNGIVTLVAGQSYDIAFTLQDTGGGSSVAAKWAPGAIAGPGGLANFVAPGDAAQAGIWSYTTTTGGGALSVTGGEMRAPSLSDITDLAISGGTLTLNGTAASSAQHLRASGGTLNVTGTGVFTTGNFTNAANATTIKTGSGRIVASTQSLGHNSTLQIDSGTFQLNGSFNAFAGTSSTGLNDGSIVVNNSGTAEVDGAIVGAVTVNVGGTLDGTGTVGPVTVNLDGNLAPGLSPGAINTGNLLLAAGANLKIEIVNLSSYDRVNVSGTASLDQADLVISTLPGFGVITGEKYFLVANDGADAVTGTFSGLLDNSTFSVGSAQFRINYTGDLTGNTTTGGNDVVLTALNTVPEPSSLMALIGGAGILAGLRRFRRTLA